MSPRKRKPKPKRLLTVKETTTLELIALGACQELIVVDLGVSINTVKGRMKTIFRKLDVHSAPHAVSRAIGLGLIAPDTTKPARRDTPAGGRQ